MKEPQPITKIIERVLRDRGQSKAHLSRMLKETASNTANKLSKNSLDTEYLKKICYALGYDFFAELSQQLRIVDLQNELEKPTAHSVWVSKDEYMKLQSRIIELLEENVRLRDEVTALKSTNRPVLNKPKLKKA